MYVRPKNNNTLLIVVLCLIFIVFFITVCRTHSTQTSVTNTNKRATSDNSNLLLGNPTNAAHSSSDPDNYLIDHTYYTESYSRSRCLPNWVCWHVDANDIGNADRLDDFRPDNNLPGGWFAVSPNNYKGSGFDKGHNCPSGDRTASPEANSATFLMDNIIPQAPKNNQQVWEHFERYCRDQTKKGNEVYVIMGNYGNGGEGSRGYRTTIGNGKITVPAHIWKVAVIIPDGNNDLSRINNKTRVIAIDTPNNNEVFNNWMDYITTVSSVELNCHCNLLSALPAALQSELERRKFNGNN